MLRIDIANVDWMCGYLKVLTKIFLLTQSNIKKNKEIVNVIKKLIYCVVYHQLGYLG